MDCPGLLEGFQPDRSRLQLMVPRRPQFNPGPLLPCDPAQAAASGLAFISLGHIHTPGANGGR